jgi:DNA-binding NarL/FixJ family response regulator
MSTTVFSPNPIRLLLADDHPVVRQGLALILDSEEDMTVVAQASNGQEAADLFRQYQPDVALLDSHSLITISSNCPKACG